MSAWNDEKLKDFHNLVGNNELELLNQRVPGDKIIECWKFLQAVVSVDSLSRHKFDSSSTLVNLQNFLYNPEILFFILENSNYWSYFLQVLLINPDNFINFRHIFTKFLDKVLKNEKENHNTILETIWSKKDSLMLPTETLQKIIIRVPYCLEHSLINLLMADSDSVNSNILWRFPENSKIVLLSSRSPSIFQNITSIMNELLFKSKFNARILEVIQAFIREIILQCAKSRADFVSLYPLKCQSLVTFLMLRNSLLSEVKESQILENSIIQRMQILIHKDAKLLICLVTHFPVCLKLLKRNENLIKECL